MKHTSLFGTLALGLALLGAFGRGPSDASVVTNGPSLGAAGGMTCGVWSSGPDVLGDWGRMGSGMMGNSGHAGTQGLPGGMWGMMGSLGMLGFHDPTAVPITTADAKHRLATFAASCGPEIHVASVTLFASDVYAQLTESKGSRLGEVLVDRYTGTVAPEPGPNLLWNTRWGVAAGTVSAPRYTAPAAQQLVATFLAQYLPGAAVLSGTTLPGYYTFAYGRQQTAEGLLSVNAMTGAIWVHVWVGPVLGAAN